MTQKIVHVALADERAYDIVIGTGVLATAGDSIAARTSARRLCVVTDETVAALHLQALTDNLTAAGFTLAAPIVLPAGEGTKSFLHLQYIIDEALSRGLDRHAALVALGGGVIGDITGFAASILLRGVDFIQIPTTLLAQVDSSVGGKTGINTARGKNLVGAFYQPKLVLIDTDVLRTLPLRELKAGYAEIFKYALIDRPAFFDWLLQHGAAVLSGDATAQADAIAESCQAKAAIVAADEREEKDIRALLNLGHTFAHALEKIGGFDGRLLHGEAVGIGLCYAADFSVAAGLMTVAEAQRIHDHMAATGLMTQPPFAVSAPDILAVMRGDKKNRDGKITLILLKGIGRSFVSRDADEQKLLAFLQQTIV